MMEKVLSFGFIASSSSIRAEVDCLISYFILPKFVEALINLKSIN